MLVYHIVVLVCMVAHGNNHSLTDGRDERHLLVDDLHVQGAGPHLLVVGGRFGPLLACSSETTLFDAEVSQLIQFPGEGEVLAYLGPVGIKDESRVIHDDLPDLLTCHLVF